LQFSSYEELTSFLGVTFFLDLPIIFPEPNRGQTC
jgi:hypothetical protein